MSQAINVISAEAQRTAGETDPTGMVRTELAALERERLDLLCTLQVVRGQSLQAQRVGQRYQTACAELEARCDVMAQELFDLRQVQRAFSRARSGAVKIETIWKQWKEGDEDYSHEIAIEFREVLRFLGVRLPMSEVLRASVEESQELPSEAPTDVEASKVTEGEPVPQANGVQVSSVIGDVAGFPRPNTSPLTSFG